jgi:hypothetical protein
VVAANKRLEGGLVARLQSLEVRVDRFSHHAWPGQEERPSVQGGRLENSETLIVGWCLPAAFRYT